ncbi:FadR family transcriptional regulator [Silicimonas algicola]|uniref:GntR family transcriptional regulator n=1 Tax=Silicimonas algicola TaxID=1826607 RepID=A0A316GG94_9RHOB|nr:FadR/GntR family transcriptional regulator [Silicimonas algicola]AZQ66638.1 FadR family transcriptional regulator [Silicimonas algicola]PWK58986.1 GntR family transcriptional regulator [Silicimonas algicola]
MNVALRPEGSPSDRVIGYFRSELISGSLRVGDRIPPERDLALKLGVGRPLLREVLKSLTMLGLLKTRQGSGTYIGKADFGVLTDFFTFCLSQEQDVLGDVMQARIAIECQAIRLACGRATDQDLAEMRKWLEVLMETLDDPEKGGNADFMFHQALVEASHSRSLTTLYAALSSLLRESHVERRKTTYRSREIIGDLVDAHREVFLAIVGKDPDEADRRLRDHFAIGDELRRKSLIDEYRRKSD